MNKSIRIKAGIVLALLFLLSAQAFGLNHSHVHSEPLEAYECSVCGLVANLSAPVSSNSLNVTLLPVAVPGAFSVSFALPQRFESRYQARAPPVFLLS